MKNIKNVPIANAEVGYQHIQGRAKSMPGYECIAPLSGKRCIWYYYAIFEEGKRRYYLDKGVSPYPFLIEDDTSYCIVNPLNAKFNLKSGRYWTGGTYHGDYQHFQNKQKAIEIKKFRDRSSLFKKLITHYEVRIDENEQVSVYGAFAHATQVSDLLIPYQNKRKKQKESDTRGIRNLQEFKYSDYLKKQIYSSYLSKQDLIELEQQLKSWLDAHQEDLNKVNFISHISQAKQPYIISTVEEKELINSYNKEKLKTYGYVVLAVLLLLFAAMFKAD